MGSLLCKTLSYNTSAKWRGLNKIKSKSLSLKFKPYNILCTNQTCKDFIQAFKIPRELLFWHCSCYSDSRGVIALPPNRNIIPRFGRSSGSNRNNEQLLNSSLWQDIVWMARTEEVLAFPSCFFFRVIAPLYL
jgi:hypothetical protein